eukprot:CAMPEP_0117660748 /NCGR_PEP_ID=MMETSP0804-20121206/7133_1 /TAXON_ID=1074897 /ORGANISM="Tetraselmis astigmatica, Strain CCMP880" /LENGTH=387 /DNA_ID=CAMNT_0005467497 /DNA_START=569 /DNA_END=1732 /DNA_ORIENTATION=+
MCAQDAVIDDMMAIAILSNAHKTGDIELLGNIIINADSVLPWSTDLSWKIHKVWNTTDVPLLLSDGRNFNAFPWEYRRDTKSMYELESIQNIDGTPPYFLDNGEEWLKSALQGVEDGSILLVHVAALTNLKMVFQDAPELLAKVKEMLWMAGAIHVGGNLEKRQFDGFNEYAEWNVFGDPEAAAWVFDNAPFPIRLFPLDLADQVPVQGFFMDTMQAVGEANDCHEDAFNAMYEAYEVFAAPQPFYRLWDTSAVVYAVHPEFYAEPHPMDLAVVTDYHTYPGWLAQPANESMAFPVEVPMYKEILVYLNFVDDGTQFMQFVAGSACIVDGNSTDGNSTVIVPEIDNSPQGDSTPVGAADASSSPSAAAALCSLGLVISSMMVSSIMM